MKKSIFIILFSMMCISVHALPPRVVVELTVNGKEYKRSFWWKHLDKNKMTKANYDLIKQRYHDAAPEDKTRVLRKALNFLFASDKDFNVLKKLKDNMTVESVKMYKVN